MHDNTDTSLFIDCPEPCELNAILANDMLSDSTLLASLDPVRAWVALAVEKSRGVDSWAELALSGTHIGCSPPPEVETVAGISKGNLRDVIIRVIKKLMNNGHTPEVLFFLEKLIMLYATDKSIVLIVSGIPDLLSIINVVPLEEISPNIKAVLSYVALGQGDKKLALEYLSAIENDAVIQFGVMLPLGRLLPKHGRLKEGKRIFRMCPWSFDKIMSMPTEKSLWYLGGLIDIENFDFARRVLGAMDVERMRKPVEFGFYMLHLVRFGLPQQALSVAERIIQGGLSWSKVYLYKFFAFKTMFCFDDAFNALDQDELLNGKNDQNFLGQGQLLWETNQFEQAISVLHEGLAHPSCNSDVVQSAFRHFLAIIYRNMGQMKRAQSEHERSVQLNPNNWRPYFDMAITLSASGLTNDALAVAKRGAKQWVDMNNMCVFLSESLENDVVGGVLSLKSAHQCFYHTRNMMIRWYPYQAWSALLAIKSFFVHGKLREIEKVISVLRKMPGALDSAVRDHACDALIDGGVITDPSKAMVFASAAYPKLSSDGFERRYLSNFANIKLKSKHHGKVPVHE